MAQPVGPQPGNNAPSKEPWRSGRPSFKAFYPELVLLTIATIAFVALGAKLSCNVLKKEKEKNAPPEVAAVASMEPNVYAQAPIDAVKYSQESLELPEEPAPAEPAVAPEPAPSVPTASAPTPLSSAPSGLSVTTRLTMIWIWCLIVPVALWIWRGWVWIAAIYGVRFELKVDEDNPRAATFLVTRGIFNKKTDSLHIGQLVDIQSSQTFLQKYLMGGVGTIVLFTKDTTDPRLYMKNMADPSRVFNTFNDLRALYWGRGGVPIGFGDVDAPVADGQVLPGDGGDAPLDGQA